MKFSEYYPYWDGQDIIMLFGYDADTGECYYSADEVNSSIFEYQQCVTKENLLLTDCLFEETIENLKGLKYLKELIETCNIITNLVNKKEWEYLLIGDGMVKMIDKLKSQIIEIEENLNFYEDWYKE